ncbi:MAG: prepilin-type N-terminal cleavage/methylation domain-containing protein, partial [Nitrospinota bacterium]|nr:prepilin-type N-terminal cleavage/methylation domain-containing protein [Nitrospinota bacterium]
MNIVKAKWRESGIHLQNGPASRIPRVFKSRPGFTLLEILVSLVVMSVGILGVTAMQAASVNGQVLSRNLGTAFNVVHDALDRMQTNSE